MTLTLTLSDSFAIYRKIIPIVIMKFVLAFLLLIGIFSQFERGNCAPEDDSIYGIYDGISKLFTGSIGNIQDTFYKYSSYLSESVHDGYSNVKDGVGHMVDGAGNMANKAEDMTGKAINNVEEAID